MREFFTLVFNAIAAKYFFSTGTVRHNSMALKVTIFYYYCLVLIYCGIFLDNTFYKICQLMAMALVNGGSRCTIIAEPVYNYIRGCNLSSIEVPVDAIPDECVRGVCHEVNSLYFP